MKLHKNLTPLKILQGLFKTISLIDKDPHKNTLDMPFAVMDDRNFYKNREECHQMRKSTNKITGYVLRKRARRAALLKILTEKVHLVIRIQACVRGHLSRVKNYQKVMKIRRDGLKGTKKWKAATKIQALFRGFSFRLKRKRALERLSKSKQVKGTNKDPCESKEEFDFMGEEEFDADAFLDIK